MMASVEDKLDALVNAKVYGSRDEVISDAMSALLTLKPRLKIDMAVNLYRNKKVSLWRAARYCIPYTGAVQGCTRLEINKNRDRRRRG